MIYVFLLDFINICFNNYKIGQARAKFNITNFFFKFINIKRPPLNCFNFLNKTLYKSRIG